MIITDGATIIYLLFKIFKPTTRIGVLNLKDEVGKAIFLKFGNNDQYFLKDMSGNYNTINYKGVRHEKFVYHIFRALLSGPNSTFNHFIEHSRDE